MKKLILLLLLAGCTKSAIQPRVKLCSDYQNINIHAGAKFWYVEKDGQYLDTTATYDYAEAVRDYAIISNNQ